MIHIHAREGHEEFIYIRQNITNLKIIDIYITIS